MNRSPIEWTNFTSNPLQYRDKDGNVVWGCVHASPGCLRCYSEALAHRYGRGGKFDVATMSGLTPFISEKEIHSILTYKPAAGKYCFLGDMTDIFGEWVPFGLIDKIFAAMALRPDVTFQLLTKRAGRALEYLGAADITRRIAREANAFMRANRRSSFDDALSTVFMWSRLETAAAGEYAYYLADISGNKWPLPNVHLGVSVENQEYADKRIPLLLQTPTAVRFVSYEPALGPVDFNKWLYPGEVIKCPACQFQHIDGVDGEAFDRTPHHNHLCHACRLVFENGKKSYGAEAARPALDWIIVGGESGPGARPFNIQWARDVVRQCKAANVSCFVKQVGAKPYACRESSKGLPDHRTCIEEGLEDLKSHKGAEMSEWPEDLRVREYPEARA